MSGSCAWQVLGFFFFLNMAVPKKNKRKKVINWSQIICVKEKRFSSFQYWRCAASDIPSCVRVQNPTRAWRQIDNRFNCNNDQIDTSSVEDRYWLSACVPMMFLSSQQHCFKKGCHVQMLFTFCGEICITILWDFFPLSKGKKTNPTLLQLWFWSFSGLFSNFILG